MPGIFPCGVGHTQPEPGGPGGCAQHQKYCVKQIVPGGCGGICAKADRTGTTPRPKATTRTIPRSARNMRIPPDRIGRCLSAAQAPAQRTLTSGCFNAIYIPLVALRSSRLTTGLEVRQLVNLAFPPSIDGYALRYPNGGKARCAGAAARSESVTFPSEDPVAVVIEREDHVSRRANACKRWRRGGEQTAGEVCPTRPPAPWPLRVSWQLHASWQLNVSWPW